MNRHGWFTPITRGAARAVVILFVMAFVLSGAAYVLSSIAITRAVASRASVVQLCRSGNEARAQQLTLWTHIIEIGTPPPHQTPAQKAQRAKMIAGFLAYIRQVFRPRDCQHYNGG